MDEKRAEAAQWAKVERLYEMADRILEEAVSPEKLTNNPYKGRPLDLSVNPFDKGMGTAYRMLKSAGVAPAWIETQAELVKEKADIRRMVDEYVNRVQQKFAGVVDDAEVRSLKAALGPEQKRFLQRVHERVARLRKRIERYNVETPLVDQQLMNVRPDEWVAQARERLQWSSHSDATPANP